MAKELFEAESGLSIDNKVHILYGNTDPFSDVDAMLAPLGSKYSNIQTGAQFTRVASNNLATDWVELAGKELAIVVNGITSTGVVIDQVPAKLADSFAWEVTAFEEGSPTNKVAMLVHMSHNGTATTPATSVKYSTSNTIKHGSAIPNVQITGTLTGTTVNDQMMNLHVSSGVATTFIAIRMIKNIAGSSTLVVGGANLDNHILDGNVHLQTWQNTLLDGVDQTLTAVEINRIKGVTSSVQTQLDAKAGLNATSYDTAGWLAGKPGNGDTMLRMIAVRAFTIPTDMALSKASAGAAATGSSVFSIKKNGVQFATFTFEAAGTLATFSTSTQQSFAAGDILTITAPATADATLADVAFSLAGTVA